MCGRYILKTSPEHLQELFRIQRLKYRPEPQYNIAPTQQVAAVVQSAKGTRGLIPLQWGLIPPWSKDGKPMINARSESAHEKPSFREAFRHQRCLIPANGFYEWKKHDKQPVFIYAKDQDTVAFAGLYSFWVNPKGEKIASCAILTTEANATIHDIHHRMPVMLHPEHYDTWLNKDITAPAQLQPLLQSYAPQQTGHYLVHPDINKVHHNSPENLEPYTPPEMPEQLGLDLIP